MKKILIALAMAALFASCRSRVYEYEDGEWQRKAAEEETATVTIHLQ